MKYFIASAVVLVATFVLVYMKLHEVPNGHRAFDTTTGEEYRSGEYIPPFTSYMLVRDQVSTLIDCTDDKHVCVHYVLTDVDATRIFNLLGEHGVTE